LRNLGKLEEHSEYCGAGGRALESALGAAAKVVGECDAYRRWLMDTSAPILHARVVAQRTEWFQNKGDERRGIEAVQYVAVTRSVFV